jgi:uncharacterized membrane-anchored protein
MTQADEKLFSKVPEVTFIFWLIKIAATATPGEKSDALKIIFEV